MSFLSDIKQYKSLSIVGLQKNTGKTVCLNYILDRLPSDNFKVAVTSIGIDGESTDQVTSTIKPEIFLKAGNYFSTSESFYHKKELLSELVEITSERSSLGRIITAKVLRGGKVLLSGPSSTSSLRRWLQGISRLDVDLSIVDGALSRLSSASPIISESLILTTGAAYSADIKTLVRGTKYIVELVEIPLADSIIIERFINEEKGLWGIDESGEKIDFKVESSLNVDKIKDNIVKKSRVIYIAGALTERFINMLSDSQEIKDIILVVRDFTKIFVGEIAYRNFIKRGGKIRVLQKSKLIAVCVNPTSPNGIKLHSEILCHNMRNVLDVPVYDIVKDRDVI